MKVAILGYSKSGKKTLFTLLSGRHIPAGRQENEVVEGNALVKDPRVDAIAKIAKPQKIKYAENVFALCPDIVDGGSRSGWLESAKKADMLCMVVRSFMSDSVYHPAGSVDPVRDRSSLHSEILLADLELVEKRLERMGKEKRGGQTPAQVIEERTLEKCKQAIEAEQYLSEVKLEEHELNSVRSLGLLTLKPLLWAYNVDESGIDARSINPFHISCKIEEEISEMKDPVERKDFLASLGLDMPGVDRMNAAVYDMLGLMSFYTMGEDEVRAWTIMKGATAPQAAGKIHTDIERGFIRVAVIKYADLIQEGSESAVKQKGKQEQKGKDYIIQDGDICHYLFNV